MSDYMDLVKKEAAAFQEEHLEVFQKDETEFGGASKTPNLMRWLDKNGQLAERVENITNDWGLKEFNWVQSNTRSKSQQGGDARSNAFASFYKDVRQALKKLVKQ